MSLTHLKPLSRINYLEFRQMKIDSLTFQSTLCTDGRIAFMCPELGICELPPDADEEEGICYRIEQLASKCENALVMLWDAGELEESLVLTQLFQSIDLHETRHSIKRQREEWAILRNYPSLEGHWNLSIAIPYPGWDMPEEDWYDSRAEFEKALTEWNWMENAEKEAWEALIYKGKDDPKWIEWIQWLTKEILPGYVKEQQKEVWERWKKIGLPVLSFKETLGK